MPSAQPAKRVTSVDVARMAGVSRATVSFVLNNRPGQTIPAETRARVLDAAQQLDYRPHASAKALAAGRSDIVVLSIPDLPIGAGISRFIEELARALAEEGLTLVTHLEGAHGRWLPDVCASLTASAVIGLESFEPETVKALRSTGARVVMPPAVPASVAMGPVGRIQATHLIAKGHTRLGYALPAHPGLRPMAQARLVGVRDACADAGLAAPLIVETGLDLASAGAAVAELSAGSVTGVCAFNDETAIAVLAGMREHGLRAPVEMAVVGADDIPTAPLAAPALTTVAFDLREVGRDRARAVVAALAGREPTFDLSLGQANLVERAST